MNYLFGFFCPADGAKAAFPLCREFVVMGRPFFFCWSYIKMTSQTLHSQFTNAKCDYLIKNIQILHIHIYNIHHWWLVDRTRRWRSVWGVWSGFGYCWTLWVGFEFQGRYRWRPWRWWRSLVSFLLGQLCIFNGRWSVSLRRILSLCRSFRLDLGLRSLLFLLWSICRYRRRLHCWTYNSMSWPSLTRRARTRRGFPLWNNTTITRFSGLF